MASTNANHSAKAAPAGTVPVAALFADLDEELAATRRLLERFPSEHADWRPHERSMTLGRLANHVAELPSFGQIMAGTPEYDLAATPYTPAAAGTTAELLELFDRNAAELRQVLASLDSEALGATWRLRYGETVFADGPRALLLRRLFVSHTAHHRGQLTVYYRLLGVPVPGMYGPSADE